MAEKINHIGVVRSQSFSSTWQLLGSLWPLMSQCLAQIAVMSIQNFSNNSVRNISLQPREIPAFPLLEPEDNVFFYGRNVTAGSVSIYQLGRYGIVNFSLNPPCDSEDILRTMWKSLACSNPIGVFSGEELELDLSEIGAVVNGKLNPIDLPMCELAMITNRKPKDDERNSDLLGGADSHGGVRFLRK
jgi:hypothetical protein